MLLDSATGEPFLPGGTLASHFSEAGQGKWNLDLGGRDPVLTLYGMHEDAVAVDLPRFDVGETEGGGVIRRGVPVVRIGGKLVTTVFDLLMAQYAVGRDGLPGRVARRLRRPAAVHAGVAGGDHLGARRPPRPGWRGSSPATPSCRGAGR